MTRKRLSALRALLRRCVTEMRVGGSGLTLGVA
jgi:hypothetical protein